MAEPEQLLADLGSQLADALVDALAGWVERCVVLRAGQWTDAGGTLDGSVSERAGSAARAAVAEEGTMIRRLLAADIDEQWTGPLHLVRRATRHPTGALASLGVPGVERDRQSEEMFPEDVYDLTPGGWADLSPNVAEVGMAWGAAKASVHRRRHESRAD